MEREANLNHWTQLAANFGSHLAATTKCKSIKVLEIHALSAALKDHAPALAAGEGGLVVEVGCGNGMNILGLQEHFPHLCFLGVDYVARHGA